MFISLLNNYSMHIIIFKTTTRITIIKFNNFLISCNHKYNLKTLLDIIAYPYTVTNPSGLKFK